MTGTAILFIIAALVMLAVIIVGSIWRELRHIKRQAEEEDIWGYPLIVHDDAERIARMLEGR